MGPCRKTSKSMPHAVKRDSTNQALNVVQTLGVFFFSHKTSYIVVYANEGVGISLHLRLERGAKHGRLTRDRGDQRHS